MGLLAAAAKEKESKSGKKPEGKKPEKKHPAAQVAQSVAPSEVPADAGQAQEAEEDSPAASAGSDDADAAGQDDAQDAGQPQVGQADQGGDAADPSQGGADDDQVDQGSGEQAQGSSPDDASQDSSTGGDPSQDTGGVDLSKLPISPALKEEFMRANAALYTALYQNDKVAQGVLNGVVPQGSHKIESVARMATLLVVQINKQLHFIKDAPQIVLPFTKDVVAHVLDLAQQVKKVQFTDQEQVACLGTALEIIMRTVGVSKKQMQALKQHIPMSQLKQGQAQYHQALAYTKGARQQDPEGPPGGGQAAPGGQPAAQPATGQPPAGGQQSPPGGPGGQPQPGAPVTAAPGPGQSAPPGGMLSAAQPPQGG